MENAAWEKLINNLIKDAILKTPRIIQAMRSVPRTNFVPKEMQSYASTDSPLQIGSAQTVSAPHMVATMNEALELKVGNKVLEVGAGSGWHAATIAQIIAPKDEPRSEWGHVYTVEILPSLSENARKKIIKEGYGDRVTIINGDGSKGYPEKAPYDKVLVTASAPNVPKPLVNQLKSGGILVIPIGSPMLFQNLLRIRKQSDGKLVEENLGGVSFVPLAGEHGHKF